MFDGKTRSRKVNLGGKRSDQERSELLRKTRESRENRAKEREKQIAAASIAKIVYSRFVAGKAKQEVRSRYLDKMAKFQALAAALAAAQKVFYPPRDVAWQMITDFLFIFNPRFDLELLPDFTRFLSVVFSAPESHSVLADCVHDVEQAPALLWRLSRVLRVLLNHWVTEGYEFRLLGEHTVECIRLLCDSSVWHGCTAQDASLAISRIVELSLLPSKRLGLRYCADDVFTALGQHLRHAQALGRSAAEQNVEQRLAVLANVCVIAVSSLSSQTTDEVDGMAHEQQQRRQQQQRTKLWGRFALSVLATTDFERLTSMAPVVELMHQDGQRVWVNALQGAVVEQTEQAAREVDKGALIRLARNAFASQLVPDVASGRDLRRNRDSEHAVIQFLGHVYSTLPIVRLLRTTESELEAGIKSPLPAGLGEDAEEEEITTQFTHGGVAALELTVNYTQRQLARQQQQQLRSIASSASDAIALLQSLLDPKLVSTWFGIVNSGAADSEQERKRAKHLAGEEVGAAANLIPQLCLMYGQLFMALPVKQATAGPETLLFSGSAPSVLNALSFGSKHQPLVTRLWEWISTHTDVSNCAALVKPQAKRRVPLSQDSENRWESSVFADSAMPIAGVLYIFFITFAHHLIAVDDEEFYTGSPLPISEVVAVTRMLRDLLFRLYWTYPVLCQHLLHETNSVGKLLSGSSPIGSITSTSGGGFGGHGDRTVPLFDAQFVLAATRLFNQLAERNDRRNFLDMHEWLWPGISEHDFDLAVNPDDLTFSSDDVDDVFRFRDPRVRWIVNSLPQVVPFAQRAKIFQDLLDIDRSQVQGGDHHFGFASAQIQVRRDRILEDAFDEMNNLGARLKGRIQVTFVSEHGYQEAGIDGGGVFKEFMDTLAQQAFDVSYGLFISTSENMLVPNPASDLARADHLEYFEFIGRVLGKAIYEQILVEPVFAKVFLNILLGRVNHIDDLYFLDAELYRSLLKLKHMPEEGKDVSTLELFFETTTHRFGETRTVELVPGGSSVRVTNDNVINYIHRLANYKLNVETAQQCRALLRGFRDLIPVGWIRMFSAHELQLLIGGDLRPIDVENMRRHTRYGGGYHDSQPYIQHFWDIVASMTPQQQANLLKFVTSCSRQPLLGFEQLSPPFCIQQIPTHDAHSPPGSQPRLPSASTCMNLLKLPKYDTLEMLRDKLLYAIQANTGFELT